MKRTRLALLPLLALMAFASEAQAQRGRVCIGPQSLVVQPVTVIPEGGFYSYRVHIFNAGAARRNFSYHFPLHELMPPPGAVYAFDIRPQQTVIVNLGTTQRRASNETLRSTLIITCHS